MQGLLTQKHAHDSINGEKANEQGILWRRRWTRSRHQDEFVNVESHNHLLGKNVKTTRLCTCLTGRGVRHAFGVAELQQHTEQQNRKKNGKFQCLGSIIASARIAQATPQR